MEKQKRIPKRRFREFLEAGEWEEKRLGTLAEFNPNTEVPDEFEYVDLESVVGTSIVSHRRLKKLEAPSRAQKLAQKGDVFFQTVRPYQKNNCVFDREDKDWVFSTGYAQLRPNGDPIFLLTLLQEDSFIQKVLDRCIGTGYPAINSMELASILVKHPSRNEQAKIGDFCRRLDTLISLHQQRLSKLKDLKQAYLTEMFPAPGEKRPRRRFKGFSGDWEKKCLADMVDGFDYGLNAAAKRYDGENKYIRITDIDDSTHLFNTDDLTSPDCNLEKASISILQEGDILFARTGASVGKTYLYRQLDGKVFFAGFLIRATVKKCYSAGFIFQNTLTNLYKEYIGVTSQRSGQPGVNAQEYGQYEFWVPSLNEQMLIARFLEKIDDNFSIETKVISKLQSLKQAYLSELFV